MQAAPSWCDEKTSENDAENTEYLNNSLKNLNSMLSNVKNALKGSLHKAKNEVTIEDVKGKILTFPKNLDESVTVERQSLNHLENDFESFLDDLSENVVEAKDQKNSVFRNVTGFSNVVAASLTLAIKLKNLKVVQLMLKLVLLLADKRQLEQRKNFFKFWESRLLKFCVAGDVQAAGDGQAEGDVPCWSRGAAQNQTASHDNNAELLGPGLHFLFREISKILPNILPSNSGFSLQAIEFLQSKALFVSYHDTVFDERFGLIKKALIKKALPSDSQPLFVTSTKTTIPVDSTICSVSNSMLMRTTFDGIWLPLPIKVDTQLLGSQSINGCSDSSENKPMEILQICVLGLKICMAFIALTVYPLVLIYLKCMYGFKLNPAMKSKSCPGFKEIYFGPWNSYIKSFYGNQTVAGHVLCLSGVGSLNSLKTLMKAPVEVFETPAVRAVVKGMWSKFKLGFLFRLALFVLQLLLFSMFVLWCIAQDVEYTTISSNQDEMVLASFVGGCVAAVIAIYFLLREVAQFCACIADDGMRDYIRFSNCVQVFSHTLEVATLSMFLSGSDQVQTRLVATYAVFSLWINLLFFAKAFRRISFLLEIINTIIVDMIPFLIVMAILLLAVLFGLIVLVGGDHWQEIEDDSLRSSLSMLDFVIRMAEGRQDLGGSGLEAMAKSVDQNPYIACTIYLLSYFLIFVISIVALNALIALMGNSFEKVMAKRQSQRSQVYFILFLKSAKLGVHCS
jgi:hypothetical protein